MGADDPRDASGPTPKLPKSLATAERWAHQAGKEVVRGAYQVDGGTASLPLLKITHGQNPVLVRVEQDTVIVFALADLDEQFHEALGKLVEPDRQRVELALRQELLSNPRAGYRVEPANAKSLAEVKRIAVERQFVVDINSTGSRNAFLDAIQEVVVVMHRALLVVGLVKPAGTLPPASGSAPGPEPPGGMYA